MSKSIFYNSGTCKNPSFEETKIILSENISVWATDALRGASLHYLEASAISIVEAETYKGEMLEANNGWNPAHRISHFSSFKILTLSFSPPINPYEIIGASANDHRTFLLSKQIGAPVVTHSFQEALMAYREGGDFLILPQGGEELTLDRFWQRIGRMNANLKHT